MASLIEEGLARPGLVQFEAFRFVHRQRKRLIAIFEEVRVLLDLARHHLKPDREERPAHRLYDDFHEIPRIEQNQRLDRQVRAALMPALHPETAALQRMDLLDRMVTLE